MRLPKLITVFKVKVNYKSGISEVFECTTFSIKGKNLSWKHSSHKYKPIDIALNSVDDIESVWQVGYRKILVWNKE